MSDYFGKEIPKLGFGLMRLPKKGLHTDIEQVKHMVDLFMEAGFTYFDTAILSRLVDIFFSRVLYPMLLLPENHSIAVV